VITVARGMPVEVPLRRLTFAESDTYSGC
jgi:hypothetical protein